MNENPIVLLVKLFFAAVFITYVVLSLPGCGEEDPQCTDEDDEACARACQADGIPDGFCLEEYGPNPCVCATCCDACDTLWCLSGCEEC